jgi:predicted nucleotidyltransferase component of viral defense system
MFALKGGTAINLFYRDLPRLSVDIDLTYLPVKDRADSLAEIDVGLTRIAQDICDNAPAARATRIAGGGGGETRLLVRRGSVEIKIETSPVLRGVVHDPAPRAVSEAVEDRFGFAEIQVVAFEDLFAGKLHAALDRQHPRDLYDVKLLYEHDGISDALFRTFLIYIASSARPVHELLAPNLIDLDQPYAREFEGMTSVPISLDELMIVREKLVADVQARLDDVSRQFLLSLHDCSPDFDVIGHPKAAELPAIR